MERVKEHLREGGRPRFFADSMLGKLARWMRTLGYDVAYEREIEDSELVARALRERRIILTRDRLLVKRRGARDNHIFIEGDRVEEQLRQVVDRFPCDEGLFLTRCLRCNTPLEAVDKDDVKGRVPPYVFRTQERFSICPDCGRIYWSATHREHMIKDLSRMLGRTWKRG